MEKQLTAWDDPSTSTETLPSPGLVVTMMVEALPEQPISSGVTEINGKKKTNSLPRTLQQRMYSALLSPLVETTPLSGLISTMMVEVLPVQPYTFKRNPQGRWAQTDKLTLGKNAVALDTFGVSVSLSGDTAIIGAHQRDIKGKGNDSGAAYIFERAGEKWIEKQELVASDGKPGDYFGFSCGISGDYAIVGAYLNDAKGEDAGSAYIYERDAVSKKWVEAATITAGDTAAGDWFGYAVSIGRAGGNIAAMVGAPLDDDKGLDSGSVYSFARAGGWIEKKKTTNSDGAEDDYFGSAVNMGGSYSISGAYRDDDAGDRSGAAYIYHSISDLALSVEEKLQQFVLWGQIRKDALYQNFPNPFNPETWLPYQLATEADVSISIYNVNGHLIRTLDLGTQPEGIYITKEKAAYWDGQNDAGEQVASGSYFYRLQAGDYSATKKMIILK